MPRELQEGLMEEVTESRMCIIILRDVWEALGGSARRLNTIRWIW